MTDEAGRGLDSKAQPSEMQPSETLGRYRLLERIAVGGMAEVYKAKSFGVEGFEKLLVIKRIVPELARHEQFVGMFVQEAKLAVQLSHNNIVQVFDLGRIDGEDGTASYFIAMEYVPGHDLQTLLEHLRSQFPTDWSFPIVSLAGYYALNLVLLAYLDTLLTALVVDKLMEQDLGVEEQTKQNKELAAQGLANAAAGLIGGIPGAQATIRSVLILKEGATMRIAGGADEMLLNTIAEKILGLPQDHRPDKGIPFNQIPA